MLLLVLFLRRMINLPDSTLTGIRSPRELIRKVQHLKFSIWEGKWWLKVSILWPRTRVYIFVQLALRGIFQVGMFIVKRAHICLMDAYMFSKPTAHWHYNLQSHCREATPHTWDHLIIGHGQTTDICQAEESLCAIFSISTTLQSSLCREVSGLWGEHVLWNIYQFVPQLKC